MPYPDLRKIVKMMIETRDKAVVIILSLLFSGMVLGTHFVERLFPVLPISLIASMGVIVLFYLKGGKLIVPILLVGFVTALHLSWTTQFGASVMRTDPDRIALWTQSVIESGSSDTINNYSSFYGSAPIMFLLGAIVAIVLDISAPVANILWPIATAFALPTTTSAIVWRLWDDTDASLVAGVFAATFTHTHMYSFGALPQTISVYFWAGFLLVGLLLTTMAIGRHTGLLLLGLFFISSVFSHKISVFIMMSAFAAVVLAITILRLIGKRNRDALPLTRSFTMISAISALLLAVQWEHITGYTERAIARILAIGGSPSGLDTAEPTAAVALNGDPYSLIAYSMQIVVGLAIAGICWLYLSLTEYDRNGVVYILVICAVVVAMAIGAIFAPVANGRIHFFAEPLLAVIIAGTLIVKIGPRKSFVAIAILAFISVQLFAAPATPDYPNTSQSYLEQTDVEAKSWGETHADTVHTDHRYKQKILIENIEALDNPDVYQSYNESIFDGEIHDDHSCAAYRDNADDIHAGPAGTYQLTWDLETELQSEFSQIYSNTDVRQYCR
ncbi:hypothetical protein [Natronococcus sp. A-GB7]|uniref:hypothetical protein n=1 Tax=Natronococcus sp. A-GB7 TaxID=3037649 RepID=UPI00241EB4F3|nr:hypothetical protein [Natronococcus sp. A-GB7]MDG5821290.1 hypothetical protein [Natronococcus sp. A-GB7]